MNILSNCLPISDVQLDLLGVPVLCILYRIDAIRTRDIVGEFVVLILIRSKTPALSFHLQLSDVKQNSIYDLVSARFPDSHCWFDILINPEQV